MWPVINHESLIVCTQSIHKTKKEKHALKILKFIWPTISTYTHIRTPTHIHTDANKPFGMKKTGCLFFGAQIAADAFLCILLFVSCCCDCCCQHIKGVPAAHAAQAARAAHQTSVELEAGPGAGTGADRKATKKERNCSHCPAARFLI